MTSLRGFLPLVILALLTTASCRKKDNVNNPCDGVLNESSPLTVSLKIIEKDTEENLLTNGSLKETDIAVVDQTTNTNYQNWKVLNTGSTASPYYGTIQLLLFDKKEGQHNYLIQLGNLAHATLQYTVTKKQTNDPCRPVAYPISDIRLTDHQFTLMTVQGKELANFLVMKL